MRFCAATGEHPGREAECTTRLFLSPLQAEDRRKRSDGIQPALQWPAALGHDAMPQAKVGSGSSSSPCTPALQRAVLVQVWCEYQCGITALMRGGRCLSRKVPGSLQSCHNRWRPMRACLRFSVLPCAAKLQVEFYLCVAA